jgi:hypothetical protein
MIHLQISDDALQDLNEGFLFYEAHNRVWVTISPVACVPTLKACA